MKKLLIIYNQSIKHDDFLEKKKLTIETFKKLGFEVDAKSNAEMFTFLDTNKAKCHSKFALYDLCIFFDYDYSLAKNLELVGVKVVNSGQAIEDCSNKASMYQKMIKNGIAIPKTIILPMLNEYKREYIENFVDDAIVELNLPLIVKNFYGNSGENTYLAKTKNDVFKVIEHFAGKNIILQEYIAESSGTDVRIFVAGKNVISALRRCGAQGDFRSNSSLGGRLEKYIPTVIDTKIALSATKAMGCDFALVDILKSVHGSLVLEVNPTCNVNHFYEVNNVNLAEAIYKNLPKK